MALLKAFQMPTAQMAHMLAISAKS